MLCRICNCIKAHVMAKTTNWPGLCLFVSINNSLLLHAHGNKRFSTLEKYFYY